MAKIVTLHLEEHKQSIQERLYKSVNYLYDGAIVRLWNKEYIIIRKQIRDV